MTTHEPALPRAMDGTYRVLACKKAIGDSAVFLAVHRGTGREVLIKIASSAEKGLYLKNEYQLLKRLEGIKAPEASLFPRAMDFLSLDDVCVLVREYLPGQTMEDYVESEPARPGIRRDTAINCLVSVLEQLSVLHRMRPPVIHRDIKPQNIIMDPHGGFHLIDFGIAREYREGDESDTNVLAPA
jgi:serine/threonine-protein kinase